MKCGVCGLKGHKDRDFIRVSGYFYVGLQIVNMVACPKCKTVILDDSRQI